MSSHPLVALIRAVDEGLVASWITRQAADVARLTRDLGIARQRAETGEARLYARDAEVAQLKGHLAEAKRELSDARTAIVGYLVVEDVRPVAEGVHSIGRARDEARARLHGAELDRDEARDELRASKQYAQQTSDLMDRLRNVLRPGGTESVEQPVCRVVSERDAARTVADAHEATPAVDIANAEMGVDCLTVAIDHGYIPGNHGALPKWLATKIERATLATAPAKPCEGGDPRTEYTRGHDDAEAEATGEIYAYRAKIDALLAALVRAEEDRHE